MHIPRGRRHFFLENLVLFCFTLCLFSCCFMVLWVMFSINVLFLSSHRVYVLDIHTSLCYCALLVACSDDHLLCYIIIVVISIWLFCVWSIFTCYIILILLSLDLPWESNAFCANVSSYRYTCFKFILVSKFRCEWALSLFPNSRLSLECVIGCFVTE